MLHVVISQLRMQLLTETAKMLLFPARRAQMQFQRDSRCNSTLFQRPSPVIQELKLKPDFYFKPSDRVSRGRGQSSNIHTHGERERQSRHALVSQSR
jgi:hypothetical protein